MTLNFKCIHFPHTGSTNDDLKELAEKGALEGTVIRADSQSMGRGRRSRPWVSPPGNLYMSLLLRPQVPSTVLSQLSFVSALALAKAVGSFLPTTHPLRLKWPNDLLYNAKKVGGILIESQSHDSQVIDWVVVGMGLNLQSHPQGTTYPATDLFSETHLSLQPDHVMDTLLKTMDILYTQWLEKGFSLLREEWSKWAYGIGQEIQLVTDQKTLTGTYLGIDDQGSLKIKLEDTSIKTVRSGDVFFKSLDYSTP